MSTIFTKEATSPAERSKFEAFLMWPRKFLPKTQPYFCTEIKPRLSTFEAVLEADQPVDIFDWGRLEKDYDQLFALWWKRSGALKHLIEPREPATRTTTERHYVVDAVQFEGALALLGAFGDSARTYSDLYELLPDADWLRALLALAQARLLRIEEDHATLTHQGHRVLDTLSALVPLPSDRS